MNVQFGLRNVDGSAVTPAHISRIKSTIDVSSTDNCWEFADSDIHLLHFRENGEPSTEQTFRTDPGNVILWDGRLDNGPELADALNKECLRDATDLEIVACAYQRWGTRAFAKLVGDWALSIWNRRERTLILAKDFLGSKPLYYSTEHGVLRWSSLLEPLVLAATESPVLSEEYIAGWFSRFPASHLTPYRGIHAVPPSSYALFCDDKQIVRTYWAFDTTKAIFYKAAREYEEHFLALFEKSVARRLRSPAPVLAELSGGMDSSSIVCMADHLLARGMAETPRLDTISYYDDTEPNWNESAYFKIVERRRNRAGLHLPVNFRRNVNPVFPGERFAATPGSGTGFNENDLYAAYLQTGRYQVLLQGLGGDEVLGGIPAPSPQLGDLLASGRLISFARTLMAWALVGRTPVVRLLADACRELFPISFGRYQPRPVPWLQATFLQRNRHVLQGYERSGNFSTRPSLRANISALEGLRRHIGCLAPTAGHDLERRYVYLDRDLLEYLYAIPREQLIRPNERRSLMRRALRGIVPDEILDRKRKAFISRAPVVAIQGDLERLMRDTSQMVSSDLGIVDKQKFQQHLKQIAEGQSVPVVPLLRTLLVEAWLRHISHWTTCCKYPFSFLHRLQTQAYTPRDTRYSLS